MTIVHKYSNREFKIWNAGKEVEGSLKWAINTNDDEFYDFTDGLWATKKEAYQAVKCYLKSIDRESVRQIIQPEYQIV
jgi:hypothetical protein